MWLIFEAAWTPVTVELLNDGDVGVVKTRASSPGTANPAR